jgi:DNA polymerase I-like protein with 3'-5' exonuclease and polymerase domains
MDGEDLHARTAEMIGLSSRDEAKPTNFGIVFGQELQALAREITASWGEQGQLGRVDKTQAREYIDTFIAMYKGIRPYFDEECEKLTDSKVSERALRNPVTGRIRRFRRRESDKLMRDMKATFLQQVESHILKVSLARLSTELKDKGMDARIVACIHDSIWVEASMREEADVRDIMERVMTATMSLSVPLHIDFES